MQFLSLVTAITCATGVSAVPNWFGQRCIIGTNNEGGISIAAFEKAPEPFGITKLTETVLLSEEIAGYGTLNITADLDVSKLPGSIFSNLKFTLTNYDNVKTVEVFHAGDSDDVLRYTAADGERVVQLVQETRDYPLDPVVAFQEAWTANHYEISVLIGQGDSTVTTTINRDKLKTNELVLQIQQGTLFNQGIYFNKLGLCV